jgi:toxin ParE1/3/4
LAKRRATSRSRWSVTLSAAAEADLAEIVGWTDEHFGAEQAARYQATLIDAIRTLRMGPNVLGARDRSEIGERLHSLHVARGRRSGRHVILFRVTEPSGDPTIEVLRLLHDSMDLLRHVPR